MEQGPIGVFDSGFGGLTVLRSLRERLPGYDYLYLGDSARTPYGTRSHERVLEFTRESVEALFEAGCPLVVVACNTASARALRVLQQRHLPRFRPDRRLLGVVRPSVEALANLPPGAHPGLTAPSSVQGTVAVLGTPGTIASGTYAVELGHLAPGLRVIQQACPLWVPLVEAGEIEGPGCEWFLHRYLDPLFQDPDPPTRILLGCTHYPLLRPGILRIVPPGTEVLSQGPLVAERLEDWLRRHPEFEERLTRHGEIRYWTTDDPGRFDDIGGLLMGMSLRSRRVDLPPFRGNE
ncbi:MAG TPA: glutamate racemase [Myxococcota bacterium]|nr:glutamate racemase [Myxococcota bacterium]HQK50737.1 glutamate racemase [Myxococcota bacterium]